LLKTVERLYGTIGFWRVDAGAILHLNCVHTLCWAPPNRPTISPGIEMFQTSPQ